MNVLKVGLLGFSLLFAFGVVLAQENAEADIEAIIALDEDVTAEDLGVSEPTLLPDNPFYFLKNWGRGIQGFFTLNPIAKIELKERFANEKLVELKKMVEQKKNAKAIERASENYQKEVEKIKVVAESIKEKAEENVRVGKFLDKFIQHQALHQRVLQKLEEQVPPEALEKIKEARERHIEKFGEVMTRLEENKEQIGERLEKNLQEIRGSEFKDFKNLEILRELAEKVPEEAKEAIQKAQENALKRLRGDLEKMSPEDQERFKEYIEKISGVKERQMEILDNLKEELKAVPQIKETLLQSREKIIEKVRETIIEKNCPAIEKLTSDFCKEGRITVKKDEKGCIISFDCVIPAQTPTTKPGGVCITLWNPVCGKDGKTYSNACFAKLAGAEINHEGICKNIQIKERLQRIILPQTTP